MLHHAELACSLSKGTFMNMVIHVSAWLIYFQSLLHYCFNWQCLPLKTVYLYSGLGHPAAVGAAAYVPLHRPDVQQAGRVRTTLATAAVVRLLEVRAMH